jgi:phosphonate transport system ATP-binding protein
VTTSGPQCAFRLQGVTVAYDGRPAIHKLDLSVAAGEVIALVGPSGAGKTTLLRQLAASGAPDSGSTEVLGQCIDAVSSDALREVRSRVALVHQDHALIPNLRVLQNVLAGSLGRRGFFGGLRDLVWPKREDVERVHSLLDRVGIEDKLYHRADTLSGGQQQRVAIARAMQQRPEALLADEPVASVDPARAEAVVGLLVELAQEDGMTLICSLHDVELARRWFPRLVGLREGAIAFDAPTAQITDADIQRLYALPGIGEVEA